MANENITSADLFLWMEKNQSQKGKPDYNLVEQKYRELADYEKRSELVEKAKAGDQQAAKDVLSQMVDWAGSKATSMGVKGIPAAVGQVVGQRIAGKPGAAVVGAGGAAIGSIAAQLMDTGEVKRGELLSDVSQGANLSRGSIANAGLNMASETMRQIIDDKRLSWAGISEAGAAGVAGAKASQAITKSANARDALFKYRDEIFQKLRNDGVVVAPQELGRPDVVGGATLNRIAGGPSVSYDASYRNQFVWQKLVREELGMPAKSDNDLAFRPKRLNPKTGAVIDRGEIGDALKEAYKPYEEIAALSEQAKKDLDSFQATAKANGTFLSSMQSPQAKDLLLGAAVDIEAMKQARKEMKDLWFGMKGGNPEAAVAYRAKKLEVEMLDKKLDAAATIWGDPGLPKRLADARVQIAKLHAVEDATVNAYGLVDPHDLVALRGAGAKLTGRLEQIADFAEAFSRQAEEAVKIGMQPTTGFASNYALRNLAQGNIQGPISAGVPIIGDVAREALLSDWMQNRIAKPSMTPNQETIPASAVRSGLLVGGRDNTGQRKPPYR